MRLLSPLSRLRALKIWILEARVFPAVEVAPPPGADVLTPQSGWPFGISGDLWSAFYCTVKVTVVIFCNEPDVPLTVMV